MNAMTTLAQAKAIIQAAAGMAPLAAASGRCLCSAVSYIISWDAEGGGAPHANTAVHAIFVATSELGPEEYEKGDERVRLAHRAIRAACSAACFAAVGEKYMSGQDLAVAQRLLNEARHYTSRLAA